MDLMTFRIWAIVDLSVMVVAATDPALSFLMKTVCRCED
jgi:hypothetical protein